MKYALSGKSFRKNINFAYDTEDHQRTERISPELANGYRPEYAVHTDATCFSETNLLYMKNFHLLYQPYMTISPQLVEQIQ